MGGGGSGLGSIGTIAGAGAGFMLGGPAGAALGASLGGSAGSLLGGGTDAKYNPQGANLVNTVDPEQVKAQYGNINTSLQQQQDFVKALQAQNGIGNQNTALQMALQQAQGTGPNPALAQLNQQTAANTANQAAMMAGQRGAGQNAGLIARQAAMQGAQNQQNAIGQSATMQAQQQLAGQQMLANMAQQQIGNQAAAQNQYGQQAANAYGQVSGNVNNLNQAMVGNQANLNNANVSLAQGDQQASNNMMGNLMGAAGSAIQLMGSSKGAPVKKAEGGLIDSAVKTIKNAFSDVGEKPKKGAPVKDLPKKPAEDMSKVFTKDYAEGGDVQKPKAGPQSFVGRHFHGLHSTALPMATGDQVPALVSPGERYLPPQEVEAVAEGVKSPMQAGEKIPGKPKVGGAKNSYANDTVPKTLDEGGIVIPRSITQAKDAPEKAAAFIRDVLARHGKGMPKKG